VSDDEGYGYDPLEERALCVIQQRFKRLYEP